MQALTTSALDPLRILEMGGHEGAELESPSAYLYESRTLAQERSDLRRAMGDLRAQPQTTAQFIGAVLALRRARQGPQD